MLLPLNLSLLSLVACLKTYRLMRLHNHIAYRFLTDETFRDEVMESVCGKKWEEKPVEEIGLLYNLLDPENMIPDSLPHKVYYITDTVLDKLDMLKVKKSDGVYDWKVFADLPTCKKTFIFNDNSVLRLASYSNTLMFCYLKFDFKKDSNQYGSCKVVIFYIDRSTNEVCQHYHHPDVQAIETMVYKMMCFVFLSENTEEIVLPGRKHGTQKTGKFINEFKDIPITMVTSKWMVTVIRTEDFDVSGHFRLQRCGPGLTKTQMIFIKPFKKHGYKRTY